MHFSGYEEIKKKHYFIKKISSDSKLETKELVLKVIT